MISHHSPVPVRCDATSVILPDQVVKSSIRWLAFLSQHTLQDSACTNSTGQVTVRAQGLSADKIPPETRKHPENRSSNGVLPVESPCVVPDNVSAKSTKPPWQQQLTRKRQPSGRARRSGRPNGDKERNKRNTQEIEKAIIDNHVSDLRVPTSEGWRFMPRGWFPRLWIDRGGRSGISRGLRFWRHLR